MSKTPRLDLLLRAVEDRLNREGHGSKAALARDIGTTKQSVQDWFAGRTKPTGEMALALAEWHLSDSYSAKKKRPVRRPAKVGK
jgi:DNA-binding XRE family transcriptional regulator